VTRDSDLQHVLVRLEKLEQYNRRLKAGLAALAAAFGVALFAAAQESPRAKTVEAEQFVVVDADGNRVATLGMNGDRTGLTLYQGKKERVLLYADATTSALCLQEDKGTRVALMDAPGKTAGLVLYQTPGETKAQISVFYTTDNKPAMFFNDAKGKSRVGLSLRADGKPAFTLADENGRTFYSQFQR
jgi:hypothetical protein